MRHGSQDYDESVVATRWLLTGLAPLASALTGMRSVGVRQTDIGPADG